MSLLENANTLSALLSKSQGWLQENGHSEALNDLREQSAILERAKSSLQLRPMFALFGPSQVGKSYLASNALSDGNESLEVLVGDEVIDFIEDINPAGGGTEATGVVTRFSINPPLVGDYCVKIKLLRLLEYLFKTNSID